MLKIKKIAIVWESETGGGVNSYLRYLLQSKAFINKDITIFTNSENKLHEIYQLRKQHIAQNLTTE